MAKNLQISLLLDFYGAMLTEKQKEVVELYYNEDLSLAEIASHSGITRQGVRDAIKRAENQLTDCEERLGLLAKFGDIQEALGEIVAHATDIWDDNNKFAHSEKVRQKMQRIIQLAQDINI